MSTAVCTPWGPDTELLRAGVTMTGVDAVRQCAWVQECRATRESQPTGSGTRTGLGSPRW